MSYVNVHGEQVALDFRALVLEIKPAAWMPKPTLGRIREGMNEKPRTPFYTVHESDEHFADWIGCGATEEAAWRDAYLRLTEAA